MNTYILYLLLYQIITNQPDWLSGLMPQLSRDTLAEWLTRGPAKPVSSEAQVRILQVSLFLFLFLL
jgi:hypothetical protein